MKTPMLLDDFRTIVGSRDVLTEPNDIARYVEDWRGLYHGLPLAVLRPANRDDVSSCVRLCAQHRIGIVPQGGNSGLAGGAVPDRSGKQVVISLEKMNAIRTVDRVGMTIEVEAGCIVQTAQQAAEVVGRQLPVRIAAEGVAQIGGIISTNAGGVNVLRHGMTRQLVLGLEVIRTDGTILSSLRRLRKDNAGYDWKQLYIGSEGTLGIVTAAVLRLVPVPKYRSVSLLSFDNAANTPLIFSSIVDELGDCLNSFEIISSQSMELVHAHCGLSVGLATGKWYLLVEAVSSLPSLEETVEAVLMNVLETGLAGDCVVAQSEQQATDIWKIRESITEAEQREGGTIKHDVSVPVPEVGRFLTDMPAALVAAFPQARVSAFGHIGDGNIHFNVLAQQSDKQSINRLVLDAVAALGGSISAEHGIGLLRVAELARYRDPGEQDISREIKNMLDPKCIMNPGKVIASDDLA